MLLVTELENADLLVVTDGVSELVSDRTPSKLGTVRIVESIFGVLPELGVEEAMCNGGSGVSLGVDVDWFWEEYVAVVVVVVVMLWECPRREGLDDAAGASALRSGSGVLGVLGFVRE